MAVSYKSGDRFEYLRADILGLLNALKAATVWACGGSPSPAPSACTRGWTRSRGARTPRCRWWQAPDPASPPHWITTLLPDVGPHSVPVMIDLEGEYLALFTSPNSRKGRNLVADDRIAISVTDRKNLVRSALVRGGVVKRVGGDAGWEIVDRVFAKYTGGPNPRREDREAFLVEPAHVSAPTFG
jgi:hypothetical protein